jgi:Family of unknown function (DUF6090)
VLLRRITEHVKTQNWFAVGLDFFIVVVGVFIGIQVSNWNDASKDRADEAAFLKDLHNDILNASQQSIRTEVIRFDQAKNIESAVELIFSDAPGRELLASECSAIAYSFATYVGRARLPSLIMLQAAGRIGIISDRKLARELAELTQRHEALGTTIREISTVEIVTKYTDIFTTNTKLIPAAGGSGELERDAETICSLGEIRANRALLNDITYNADAYDAFMRDGFKPWVAQMKQVHERIDTLLGVAHEESEI